MRFQSVLVRHFSSIADVLNEPRYRVTVHAIKKAVTQNRAKEPNKIGRNHHYDYDFAVTYLPKELANQKTLIEYCKDSHKANNLVQLDTDSIPGSVLIMYIAENLRANDHEAFRLMGDILYSQNLKYFQASGSRR